MVYHTSHNKLINYKKTRFCNISLTEKKKQKISILSIFNRVRIRIHYSLVDLRFRIYFKMKWIPCTPLHTHMYKVANLSLNYFITGLGFETQYTRTNILSNIVQKGYFFFFIYLFWVGREDHWLSLTFSEQQATQCVSMIYKYLFIPHK